ncbi:MAG: hypothetical protein ACI84K_001370 [Pseudohongiellaceae bacterium]|jgi:hypothetical protein
MGEYSRPFLNNKRLKVGGSLQAKVGWVREANPNKVFAENKGSFKYINIGAISIPLIFRKFKVFCPYR